MIKQIGEKLKQNAQRITIGLGLALIFLCHSLGVIQIPALNKLDNYIYDARLRMTAPGGIDERIVILDIDEKSLAEVGRWPWSRNKLAELTTRLFDHYRIKVLGFDVVFTERDQSSGLSSLDSIAKGTLKNDSTFQQTLKSIRGSLDYDQQFADSLDGRPVVLGYTFNREAKNGALPAPVLPAGTFEGKDVRVDSYSGYSGNLPELFSASTLAGHFNPHTDPDGIYRRVPMLVEHDGKYYEALSLAMVRVLLGKPQIIPGYPVDNSQASSSYSRVEWLDLPTQQGTLRIPVDEEVASLIPFRGPQKSFRYYPAADALAGRLTDEQLKGKIVLLGTTAPGLMDLRATPVDAVYPGVEMHANLVAGLLDGTLKQKPAYALGADLAQLLFIALLLVFLLPLLSPLKATLLTLATLGCVSAFNYSLWSSGLAMPLAAILSTTLALFAFNMSWGYFVETRSKRQLADRFGQYVPPELVEEMARDPELYSMEGKKEELTVLFSDIRGFTSISEALDSKELTRLMNEYFGAMTRVVQKNRGTLDKYIGDAIMAFWGAPVTDADHARHAVQTALQMQTELRKLDAQFSERGWPILHIGVGINTGTMTVGDMGSEVRKSYTVMGDAVNLGSRLEGITKKYGVEIIVSETTKQLADKHVYRELDRVRVKGKQEPVAIFEPLGEAGHLDQAQQEELRLWQQALRAYRQQDWDQAELLLYNLARMNPDHLLYKLYSERVAEYRAKAPGANWDGVTTFETK